MKKVLDKEEVLCYYSIARNVKSERGDYMNAKKIGERLLNLRKRKSQDEVAREVGISVSALSMYEQGNRVPRDEIKVKLASYFGVTVEEIFFEN